MANKGGIIMCAEADFGTAPHPDPLFKGQLRLIMREHFSQQVSLTLANLNILHRAVMNELLHSCSRIIPVDTREGVKYRLNQAEVDVVILRRLLELRCITSELIDGGESVRYRLTLLGREIAIVQPVKRIRLS